MLDALQKILRLDWRRRGGAITEVDLLGSKVWYVDLPARERDAPTMVLVHGLGGSATSFYPVVQRLRSRYRVVIPDLPGYGWSRPPAGRDFLPFAELLHVTERLVERVAPAGAYVAGNSMGGWLTAKLAARRPDLVRAAAMLNPAGPALRAEDWVEFGRVLYAEDRKAMREFFARLFHRPSWGVRFVELDFKRILNGPPVRNLVATLQPDDFLSDEEMARVRCAAMLVWGENDRLLPQGIDRYYIEKIPHLRVERLAECGHCPQLERPMRTATLLAELHDMAQRHAAPRAG